VPKTLIFDPNFEKNIFENRVFWGPLRHKKKILINPTTVFFDALNFDKIRFYDFGV
jgi:hypothetical protein